MVDLQRRTKVFRYITAYGEGGGSEHILIYLNYTKYNELTHHSDVQKHVPYTGSHKYFLIHYGLCLKTAGNVFSMCFMVSYCYTKV